MAGRGSLDSYYTQTTHNRHVSNNNTTCQILNDIFHHLGISV